MQITIERIFPMAAGAKSGGLKGTDGVVYKCLPHQFKFLTEGDTIDVAIKESEFQGKTYYWFDKNWPPKGAAPPVQQPHPPQGNTSLSAPPRPQANGNGMFGGGNQDFRIAHQAILKSMIESKSYEGIDLLDQVDMAGRAAAKLWQWQPAQSAPTPKLRSMSEPTGDLPDDPLPSDKIPF